MKYGEYPANRAIMCFERTMKYLSFVLILLAGLVTIFANAGFVNDNSPQIIKSFLSFFLEPFHEKLTEVTASNTPTYLIEKNSTFILIGVGVLFCLCSAVLEFIQLSKLGRNSKSAFIVTLAVVLLYFNANIYSWNTVS